MKTILSLITCLVLAGCTSLSSTMVNVNQNEITANPAQNEARIVFMRPSIHGRVIQSALYHLNGSKEEFLGFVPGGKKLLVKVEPGEHQFMITSQYFASTDILHAKLEGGKTYYALVSPRGWPEILFALLPLKNTPPSEKYSLNAESFKEWDKDTVFVKKSAAADIWADENAIKAHAKREAVYPGWVSNAENLTDRYSLVAADGK